MARLLAELTMTVHFSFLAFVVLGGFLAWRWPKVIILHLLAVGWGFLIVVASLPCPLTFVEDYFRRAAGQLGLREGFIDTYIDGVLYPEQYAQQVRLLVLVVVLLSWLGTYRHASRRGPRAYRPL